MIVLSLWLNLMDAMTSSKFTRARVAASNPSTQTLSTSKMSHMAVGTFGCIPISSTLTRQRFWPMEIQTKSRMTGVAVLEEPLCSLLTI